MIRIAGRIALALAVSSLSPEAARAAMQTPSPASFKIVVIAGEDAVNVVQQKTATAPVIEVRDSNNQPIAGVIVRFTIRNGRNARFASGARSVSLTTNVAGRAATTGLTPTGTGLVQIDVAATLQGQSAAATIVQTNFATAAQAAAGGGSTAASGASGGGGGGLSTTTLAVVGGAAAGGVVTATQIAGGNSPPEVCGLSSLNQTFFLMGADVVPLTADGCDPDGDAVTIVWDFGDGTTATGSATNHVFMTAGTFTVTVSVSDGNQTSPPFSIGVFNVIGLTGRWRVGTSTTFYDLVHTGSSITGTVAGAAGTISGSTRMVSPQINFTITQGPIPLVFSGSLNGADANTIFGAQTGVGNTTLTRQ